MSAPVIPALDRRVEARAKVTGAAKYAYEYPAEEVAYAWIVAASVTRGRITSITAPDGVTVLTHENTPRLREVDDHELEVLQRPDVAYRGQVVACVVADSLEAAREAAAHVRIEYDTAIHDSTLVEDHPKLYTPEVVNPAFPAETSQGDFGAGFAEAEVQLDLTYRTPAYHNNAMEPHATLAIWGDDGVTFYDSNQGAPAARAAVAEVLGLEPSDVRVIAEHVGGGFGSKGTPRPNMVLAALCSKVVGRPVKLAVTRQQMFAITGYRTPTIQRLRIGADASGRIGAIAHDVVEQTSTVKEFAEQTAVPTRMMYAAAHRRTGHRLAPLDVPTPSWMRAPGECPGMFALESAMDELAAAVGLDPIELRVRNEPEIDPDEGLPFSSRGLIECLREGAKRFGWEGRGRGCGVAASTYPAMRQPAQAFARREDDGFVVGIGAADIGTGARTVLTQIAAEALDVSPARVEMRIGDSALPPGPVAGGSAGTASWGSAVHGACRALRANPELVETTYDTAADIEAESAHARHAFGAQFAQVSVNRVTGEVRVERLLGVFAAGRILNPKLARSQFIGGMTMGVGMALTEESVLDPVYGDFLNHDLAQYHVPVQGDVPSIEAVWLEEDDPHLNPMGSKGIGEIGIVGTAAAIANAVHDAVGVRFRELPIRPDRVLEALR
jgi:xanthine dehydrogenase YagR molybdenum-binding subunit